MATTCHTYTKLQDSIAKKLANLSTDTLKVMLLSAYTPAVDTHQFVSDVLGAGTEVAAGGGYSTGGVALSGVTFSDTGHVSTLTCSSPSWAPSTFAAAFAVFYDSTPGTSATNPVIVYWDFGGTQTGTGGTFSLNIAGTGLLTMTGSG